MSATLPLRHFTGRDCVVVRFAEGQHASALVCPKRPGGRRFGSVTPSRPSRGGWVTGARWGRHGQSGAALIIFAILVVLVMGAVMYPGLSSLANRQTGLAARTSAALVQARAALIVYAATCPDVDPPLPNPGPGRLPCPDVDDDGRGDAPCGNPADPMALGRLPWRDLGLADLRDGHDERLWYAVSGSLRAEPPAPQVVNSDTPGQLSFDGTGDMAAVVLAPGPALAAQAGRPSNAPGDYLEGENADGDVDFGASPSSTTFNDQALGIPQTEVVRVAEQRVLHEVAQRVASYRDANGQYPFMSLLGTATGGSAGPKLEDSNLSPDFGVRGVAVDDVVWTPAAAQAQVEFVTGAEVRVRASSGVTFHPGDAYEIRTRKGFVTGRVIEDLASAADSTLPGWFAGNGWDALTYGAVSAPETAVGGTCDPGASCLGVQVGAVLRNDVPALLVMAGRQLASQPARPSPRLDAYLEGSNNDGDDSFTVPTPGAGSNDQIHLLTH